MFHKCLWKKIGREEKDAEKLDSYLIPHTSIFNRSKYKKKIRKILRKKYRILKNSKVQTTRQIGRSDYIKIEGFCLQVVLQLNCI